MIIALVVAAAPRILQPWAEEAEYSGRHDPDLDQGNAQKPAERLLFPQLFFWHHGHSNATDADHALFFIYNFDAPYLRRPTDMNGPGGSFDAAFGCRT